MQRHSRAIALPMKAGASNSFVVLTLIGVMGLTCNSQQPQKTGKVIWTGHSSGFAIHWTHSNLIVTAINDSSKMILSARDLAQRDFDAFKRDNANENRRSICSYGQTFKLLSVVGSLISYEQSEDSYCRSATGSWAWPHPNTVAHFQVIDVSNLGRQVELTDLFPENVVLEALLADPLIKGALESRQSAKTPKTLAALLKLFEAEDLSLSPLRETADAPKGCTFSLPDDVLKQFAFHHIEDGRLAVLLNLEPDSGACRTARAQLGIVLPIPEPLRGALRLAQDGKEGLLMKENSRIAGGRLTRFSFTISDRARSLR